MSNGQTTGAALGDALAASANTLLSFFIRKQQIEISRQNANTQENRSNVLNDLNTLESLLKLTTPGTVLSDYPGLTPILTRLAGPDGYESMKDFKIPTDAVGSANALAAWKLSLAEAWEKDATPEQLAVFRERVATKLGTGESISINELITENRVARFTADGVVEMITTMRGANGTTQHVIDQHNVTRAALGLPLLVSAINPVNGETIIFGSKESATLTVGLMGLVLREGEISATKLRFDITNLINQATPAGYNLNSLEAGAVVDALMLGTIREGENEGRSALEVLAEEQPRLTPMIVALAQGQLVNQHNIVTVIRSLGPEVAPKLEAAFAGIMEIGKFTSDDNYASMLNSLFRAVNEAHEIQVRQAGLVGPDDPVAPLLPEFDKRTFAIFFPIDGIGPLSVPISTSLDAATAENPQPERSDLIREFKADKLTEAEMFISGFTFDEIQKLKDEVKLEAAALGG